MKNKQPEKMYIGVFSAIVLIACVSILVRFFTQEVLVDTLHIDNGVTRAILFDMQNEGTPSDAALENNQKDTLALFYGTPGVDKEAEPADAAGGSESCQAESVPASISAQTGKNAGAAGLGKYVSNYETKIAYFKKGITNWATDNIAAYKFWVSAASGYNKILHWRVTPRDGYNSVIFLRDGQLTTFIGRQDMTGKANSVLELNALANRSNICFLYVQYPYKIRESDPESGKLDFSNQNADQTIALLRAGGVQVLDLRDAWNAYRNEDSYAYRRDVFYITDQHWRAETGLWAAGTIAEYANEHFNFQIDLSLFNPGKYQYDVYPGRLLGSYGRQVTLALAEPEDFTLVYPKFETSFDFPLLHAVRETDLTLEQRQQLKAINEKKLLLNGSFEMFFDYSMLEPGDYYKKVAYFTYVDNIHDLLYTHNNLNDDGKSVLFLTDSFGRTCVPFFALGVTDTKRIRPDAFSGSWQAYFEAEHPNLIVYFEG